MVYGGPDGWLVGCRPPEEEQGQVWFAPGGFSQGSMRQRWQAGAPISSFTLLHPLLLAGPKCHKERGSK